MTSSLRLDLAASNGRRTVPPGPDTGLIAGDMPPGGGCRASLGKVCAVTAGVASTCAAAAPIFAVAAGGARLAYPEPGTSTGMSWLYEAGAGLVNVHGRSADLAFALAFAAGVAATSQGLTLQCLRLPARECSATTGRSRASTDCRKSWPSRSPFCRRAACSSFPPSTSATSPASCGVRPPNGT